MNTELASLQKLSYNVILKEFARYVSLYTNTNDNYCIKHLYFLQRIYSQSLFEDLHEMHLLRAEYLDFLLNDNLKKLDIGIVLSVTDKDTAIKKITPICSSLNELDRMFDCCTIDCQIILKSLITLATNVSKICIPYICDDELLKLIAKFCSKLVKLDISDSSEITGDGLKALCLNSDNEIQVNCPLEILNINNTYVTDEDVAVILKYMPTLQELDYPHVPEVLHSIHKEFLHENVLDNTVKYNLVNLNFEEPLTMPPLLSRLKMCANLCPHVKEISVTISTIEELDACNLFLKLENISINNCKSIDIDLSNFLSTRGSKLKKLSISLCSVPISSLIENCYNLESLILDNCQYQKVDKTTKSLNYLESLELNYITFHNSYCTESVIALLTSSPNLKELSLLHSDFGESEMIAQFSTFSLNCKLEHLSFSYSDVGIDLLQQIVLNCNLLKSLTLECCENLSYEDVDNLNQTITSSNRLILVNYNDEQSEFSFSDYDYDLDCDGNYDIYDDYDDYGDDGDFFDEDGHSDDDDDDYYPDHHF